MVGIKIFEINTIPTDLAHLVTRFAEIFASMTWGDPAQELDLDRVNTSDDNYFASFSTKVVSEDPRVPLIIDMYLTIFFEVNYKKEKVLIKAKNEFAFSGKSEWLLNMIRGLLNRIITKDIKLKIIEAVEKALEFS
ncbi:MAG: hypothetical protein ACFFCS_24255 [Candidatus Hodarchaeota archaeon]